MPSISTVPGYTVAVSGVGMLGDGITHGRPVSLAHRERVQPPQATTSRSTSIRRSAWNRRASSPIVMPCRMGNGCMPMNDANAGSSSGPSIATPPMGFGRSSTTNVLPASAQASIDSSMVHRNV